MAINWGLLGNQQGQFQNALAMGAQFGAAAAERKNQEGYRNALMNYDPSNPGSAKEVMRYNPEAGFKLQQQAAAQQQAAQKSEIQRLAAQGDPQAMLELAGIDVQAWNTLDKASKAQIALTQEQRGNAALDALRSRNPRAAVEAYAQNSGDNEAAGLLQLNDQELIAALRTEVAEANMIKDLLDREEPNWRVIPQGGVVVDVNNPRAVSQFSGGGSVSVSSPQEAAALPPGTRYTTPDGQEYIR